MKIKNLLPVTFIILLIGCSKQAIKIEKDFSRLEHINKYKADFSQEQSKVLLAIQKFNSQECLEFFGVDVIKYGYQPLQLTISNFSQDVIYLSPTNLSLKLISPEKVASSCHWKTNEITTSAGTLAYFFFWPALIPTAYCGMEMQQANEKISKNIIKQDVVQCWDNVSILPSENVSKIIFVSIDDFKNNFLISLVRSQKENLEFKVNFN